MANGRDWAFGLIDCKTKEVFLSDPWSPDFERPEDVRALVIYTWAWVRAFCSYQSNSQLTNVVQIRDSRKNHRLGMYRIPDRELKP